MIQLGRTFICFTGRMEREITFLPPWKRLQSQNLFRCPYLKEGTVHQQVRWAGHVANHLVPVDWTIALSVQIILTCTEIIGGWCLIGLKMSSSDSFLWRVHSASLWASFPTGPLQLHSAELSCLPPGRHLLLVPHAGISHPAPQHLGVSSARAKELFPNILLLL